MFTYQNLLDETEMFCRFGCEVGSIGNSVLGQRIPYVYIGNDKSKCIIVQGGIHAREHITSLLVVCMAKYLRGRKDLSLLGGIYFIPMVNPDGVRLAQEGLSFIEDEKVKEYLIRINKGSTDFSMWKANIRGIDLNVNFDAGWGKGEKNITNPSKSDYIGEYPFSEPETKRLAKITESLKPLATLSYHCKGEVIYWRYNQQTTRLWRDYRIAKGIAKATGYALEETPNSHGGYKDWCIDKLKIPAYTIEVGSDNYSHPYPYEDFFNLLSVNQDVPRRVVNSLAKMKTSLPKINH